jgi:hypothetical protein
MNCEYVHTWLMQVDSLLVKDWPRDMNRHLKSCAACAKLARNLFKLEQTWRDQPVPAECNEAKVAFLKSIAESAKPTKTDNPAKPKPVLRPWHPVRWAAAAAMVLIGISAFAYLLYSPGQIQASDVVERLSDLNLELINAEAKDRPRLLDEKEPKLRKDFEIAKPTLSAEDAELADYLFENAKKLASTDDLEKEAELATDAADKLLAHAEKVEMKGNPKETERCGARYSMFMQHGVNPLFIKLSQFKMPDKKGGFEKGGLDRDKGGLDREKERDKGGFERMMKMQQRSPEFSRPDLHKKFENWGKKGFTLPKMGGKH